MGSFLCAASVNELLMVYKQIHFIPVQHFFSSICGCNAVEIYAAFAAT